MNKLIVLLTAAGLAAACTNNDADEVGGAEMTRTNNHVDYVEFAAQDLVAIKAFYAAAFDWEFQDWGPDYVSFTGAGLDGGFRGGETPAAGGALVILYAKDLAVSEKRVTDAGGEIIEHLDFPGGKRFHFRDPAGNVLGVWVIDESGE